MSQLPPSPDPTTDPTSAEPQKRRSSPVLIVGIAVVGLLLLTILYVGILNPSSRRVSSGTAPPITFTTYDGQEISLEDLRGKPVVVNFWASWCLPCREEQPLLEAAWRKYQDDVHFVGLSYLDQKTNAEEYLDEFKVSYPNGPDMGSRIYTAYHVQGVPETFFIDAEGNLLVDAEGNPTYHVGTLTNAGLETRIQQLLAAQD